MSRRTLLAAAVVAAAVAGRWMVRRAPPPGDEALVLELLESAARAAEARRPADAVAGVSEAFLGQGLTRRELEQLVAVNALRRTWVVVKVVDARVRVEGDGATATLALVLSRGGPGAALADLLPSQASAWHVEAGLRREASGWRVVGATWAEISLAEALAPAGPR
jgi:hypothetical protein